MTAAASALRKRMVRTLTPEPAPPWGVILERVPRHVFVPRFVGCWPAPEDGSGANGTDGEPFVVDAEHDCDRWLRLVYSDRLLIVVDDGTRRSSSSMPSAMLDFLRLLDVQDGNTILEIGTGTGYNAALLCERVGSERVTSIDIDAELVDAARLALASCGYAPALAAADGYFGFPERAPYDRIIATASVRRIPPAWGAQLAAGGVLVAPMHSGLLVGLHRQEDGTLVSETPAGGVSFMNLRSPALPDEWAPFVQTADQQTIDPPPEWMVGQGVRFHTRLLMPDLEVVFEDHDWALASRIDGSWARVIRDDDDGTCTLACGGPRRLWDEYEAAAREWDRLGQPDYSRYGLTVHPDGRHVVWLDFPDSRHRWDL